MSARRTMDKRRSKLGKLAGLYGKFLSGKPLTLSEAILVNCYMCNGQELEDCGNATVCPLYPHGLFKEPTGEEEE